VFFPVFADVMLVLPVLAWAVGVAGVVPAFPGPTERPGPFWRVSSRFRRREFKVLAGAFKVQEALRLIPAARLAHPALFFATPR
jgi:hypothetical protein